MSRIENDTYWYHDFDCFQLNSFTDPLGNADMGLTNYGRMPRLCSASVFFKPTAEDIFDMWKYRTDNDKIDEEHSIMRLINDSSELQTRVKLLNITYAIHLFNFRHCHALADKPLRAAHFHLTPDKYDFYVKGRNKLGMVIIPNRLINIFNQHGWTDGQNNNLLHG
jgi:hypothetical protein